jgi:hypothetical protein
MSISQQTEFLNMCIERRITLKDKREPYSFEIKRLAEHINFKCNFIKGVCNKVRADPKNNSDLLKSGCCCSNCASNIGYLKYIHLNRLNDYVYAWNNKTGFLRVGGGCQLSYELRSQTCLRYACDMAGKELTPLEKGVINLISYTVD